MNDEQLAKIYSVIDELTLETAQISQQGYWWPLLMGCGLIGIGIMTGLTFIMLTR